MNFEEIIKKESNDLKDYYRETCIRARLPLKIYLNSITEQLMEKLEW
jgi:hypothetical protein